MTGGQDLIPSRFAQAKPKCYFADGIFLSVRLWLRLILVECDPFLVWLLKATPRETLWKHINLTTVLTEQRGSPTGKSQTAVSRYNDTQLLFILISLGTALVLWDIKESCLMTREWAPLVRAQERTATISEQNVCDKWVTFGLQNALNSSSSSSPKKLV